MAGANLTVGVNNSQFKSAMSDMTRDMKGLQSQFNLTNTQAKLYGSETDKLKAKKAELTQKIEIQANQTKLLRERISGVQSETEKYRTKQGELNTKIDEANKRYKESVELTGKNSEESQKLKGELDQLKESYARTEKAIDSKGRELDNLNNKLNNSEAALLENKSALESVSDELRALPFDAVAQKLDTFGDSAINAGKHMSIVSAGIVGFGTTAFKMAGDFEDSMAKVMTIADSTEVGYDDLKKSIVDLSDQTGISANEIADNVYNAISAGQSTGDAVAFVSESTKLAKAGFAEAGQSLDVLTTILNAYGLESTESARISDTLIQIQNKGKTTVADLSSSMGKIIPTANATNVGIEQLGAGYALMTSNGIATAETTTYMNSMLNELGKTGTKSSDLLKNTTGKTFQELMSEGNSLSDVLVIMEKEAGKNGQSLSDMFGSAEAGKAALTLVKGEGQEFNNLLKDMENASGATNEAFETVSNTTNEQMSQGLNAAKNAMTDLGTEIMVGAAPIIKDFTSGIKDTSEWFRTLDSDTKQNILQIGGFVAAIGPGLVVVGTLSKGLGKAVGGFKDMYTFSGKAIGKMKDFAPHVKDGAKFVKDLGLNLGKSALEFGKMAVQTGISTVKTIASNAAHLAGVIATNGMALAQGALNLVMSMNPITLILIGIAGLIAGLVVLWNKCEWFRDGVMNVWDTITGGISSFVESTKEFFTGLGSAISGKWTEIKEDASAKWNEMTTGISDKWIEIKTDTSEKWAEMTTNLSTSWENIKTDASTKWNDMKTDVSTKWNDMKTDASTKWVEITTDLSTKWTDMKTDASTKWNDIKTDVSTKWNDMKTDTTTKWQEITTDLSTKWSDMKTDASTKWMDMKTDVSTKWMDMKSDAWTKWTNITSDLSTKWEGIKTNASTKFGDVYTKISDSWDNVKTNASEKWANITGAISDGIEACKKLFNFTWKLPELKMPRIKASGEFSLNPLKVPSFGIDWYHTGAIFNKRTVLPGGIGVGDKFKGTGNNAEAIIPLDSMYKQVATIIKDEFDRRDQGRNTDTGLKIVIENFVNNRETDIEELVKEIEYYRKKVTY